jgi:hypothetical protein
MSHVVFITVFGDDAVAASLLAARWHHGTASPSPFTEWET